MPEREPRFDWSVLRPTGGERDPSMELAAEGRRRDQPARLAEGGRSVAGISGTSLPLRVNDLKQYAYCPRIVFFQYAMPVARKATFKMEHGKAVEPRMEHLERRRKLREYGLDRGQRRFQVWLTSARLDLSGRLDLLITTPEALYPVDFKDTLEPVRYNHHVQLCAYALLVEECFETTVSTGFIYRIPRDDVVAIEVTADLRADTLRCLDEIRTMISDERMPPPTTIRGRCSDCEYRNYCGDVF
jgi:CRISPR-associated exonuclease Cas4